MKPLLSFSTQKNWKLSLNGAANLLTGDCCIRVMCTFTPHQKKGGIHAIYRSVMDHSGNYRLTVCPQNNLPAYAAGGHQFTPVAFYYGSET